MRELLQESQLASQCLTFDALHTQSQTLEMVQNAQGTYIAQVKANQPMLLEDLQDHIKLLAPVAEHQTSEKGHGRIEERNAFFYPTDAICFEQKWDSSKFATLVVVERESTQCKTGKVSRETSYYLSIAFLEQIAPQEFSQAIRQHWSIEADNWVRDATFREDRIRCKEPARSKSLASIISVAGNLLRQHKKSFLKAMQEDVACDPTLATPFFKHADFLWKGRGWSDVLNPNSAYIKCRLKAQTVNDVKSMSLYDELGVGDDYLVTIIKSMFKFL